MMNSNLLQCFQKNASPLGIEKYWGNKTFGQ
jgi:hypothetical protein